MNRRNMKVMTERMKRGELVRNKGTLLPGWPYRIISTAPTLMAAEPRATRPPERRDDDVNEPPLYLSLIHISEPTRLDVI
eukprot:7900454-Prorocentrum_lima.AAC.1